MKTLKALFLIVKGLFFYLDEAESHAILRSAFNLKNLDSLFTEPFYNQKIGRHNDCLTPEMIVEYILYSRYKKKVERHVKICEECNQMYSFAKTQELTSTHMPTENAPDIEEDSVYVPFWHNFIPRVLKSNKVEGAQI